MTEPIRVGLVGCGAISGAYLSAADRYRGFEIVALADINRPAADAKAAEFDIKQVLSVRRCWIRSQSIWSSI